MKERVIWNSEPDTSDEAIQSYRNGFESMEGLTDEEIVECLQEDTILWYSDERANLDIQLDHPILAIADLGLWFGRRSGVKVINGNIADILKTHCGDIVKYYADAYNVRCRDVHHDGVNYYLFRELRGTEEQCWPLIEAVMNQKEVSRTLLNHYSRSILPYVAKVYGWPVAGRKRKVSV